MANNIISRQFLIFLLTGGTAASINYGSRFVFEHWVSFSWSIVLAYFTGMTVSFFLAKLFVFKGSKKNIAKSVLLFCTVNLITAIQTWCISMGMVIFVLPFMHINQYTEEISHAVGLAIPVFTSYFGHKYWSFGSEET